MLRALLARLGLVDAPFRQLELALGSETGDGGAAPERAQRREEHSGTRRPRENKTSEASLAATLSSSAPQSAIEGDPLLQRLAAFGMRDIAAIRLTRNRSTLVSFRAGTLRLHAGFEHAPDDVLRAVALFVSGRGAARTAARRVIVAYPIPRDTTPRPPRPARVHPDDHALAERLREAHLRLNQERFDGALQHIHVTVSRRMKTRLGHYAPARSHPGGAEIAISGRHIRRHGWREAFDTLLHEMVHQWQEENGHPIDHGPIFRRKARDVGTTPRARRILR
ncbi:MAG: SprT-like domain-containing protein [Gemmatimonadota bacterium]